MNKEDIKATKEDNIKFNLNDSPINLYSFILSDFNDTKSGNNTVDKL